MNEKNTSTTHNRAEPLFSLTDWERDTLRRVYLEEARYQDCCVAKQIQLSTKPHSLYGEFTSGPCAGLPKTTENWLERAKIFQAKKEACEARAAYFVKDKNAVL